MLSALLSGLLVTSATAEPIADRTVAIFTEPILVASGLTFGPLSRAAPIIFVPLGASFTAADIEWTMDASLMHLDADPTALATGPRGPASVSRLGFTGGWLAWGPIFHTGTRALNGFFVNPKLTIGVFFLGRDQMILNGLLGADIGYQFTLGRFYFAVVAGVSLGIGAGDNDLFAGPLTGTNMALFASGLSPAVGLNLQLLRVGYTF
jgi:hypothetical protein